MCSRYNQLPGPGGVLDQDSYIVYGLMGCLWAEDEKRKLEDQKQNSQMRR